MATLNITTPLAVGVTRDSLLDVLHSHEAMITTIAPKNTTYAVKSGDPHSPSEPCTYNVTGPTPLGKSTYPLTITNVPGGCDTFVQPKSPLGNLEIRGSWRITNDKLVEDIVIDGNFVMKRRVAPLVFALAKANVERSHPRQHKALMQQAHDETTTWH